MLHGLESFRGRSICGVLIGSILRCFHGCCCVVRVVGLLESYGYNAVHMEMSFAGTCCCVSQ